MTVAPIGWGFGSGAQIEGASMTPRARGTEQKQRSRNRAAQIAYWLGAAREVPSLDEIIDTWHVSRATAYRWRAFAESGGTRFSPKPADQR